MGRSVKPLYGSRIDRRSSLWQGMRGFYPLTEGGGGTAFDATGANPGTLHGSLTWSPSLVGPSLAAFTGGDATTTYVDCGNSPSLNPLSMTLVSCVFPLTIPANSSSAGFVVGRDSDTAGRSFAFGMTTTNELHFEINGTVVFSAASPLVPLSRWSVIGVSHTNGVGAQGYLAGAQIVSSTYATPIASSTGSTTIGRRNYVGYQDGFLGSLGWAAIWNRALTPGEHAAIGASPTAIFDLLYPRSRSWAIYPPPGTGTWGSAPVQAKGAQSTGSVSSLSVTLPTSVTKGNLILVYVPVFGTPTGVTDSQGNTYTQDTPTPGGTTRSYIYRTIPSASGPLTVTVSGSSIYVNIYVEEWATNGGTVSVDGTPRVATGTSATPAAGSITLGGNDLVASCVALSANPGTVTPGSGFTLGYNGAYISGSTEGGASEYRSNLTAGSVNPGFSLTNSIAWCCGAAAYTLTPSTAPLFRRTLYARAGSRGVA